jgi:hypothetical protein
MYYEMQYYYLDYLDHLTSRGLAQEKNLKNEFIRLRFDLLLFSNDTLCLSAPACVKLEETTKCLMELDDFWREGKIKIQLDSKHKMNPNNYFSSRIRKLENSMPEEELYSHIEFNAYQSPRNNEFYRDYLREKLGLHSNQVFIKKDKDTDKLFREDVLYQLNSKHDLLLKGLAPTNIVPMQAVINHLQDYSKERTLFQRSFIEHRLYLDTNITTNELFIVRSILDMSYIYANAEASSAIPLSLETKQVTGKSLSVFLNKCYKDIYDKIIQMDWHLLYLLSKYEYWHEFIEGVNCIISFSQRSAKETTVNKDFHRISSFLWVYHIFRVIREISLESIRTMSHSSGILLPIVLPGKEIIPSLPLPETFRSLLYTLLYLNYQRQQVNHIM